jgi:hypothetical protein
MASPRPLPSAKLFAAGDAVKAVKKMLNVFRGNAKAGISDGQVQAVLFTMGADGNTAVFPIIL